MGNPSRSGAKLLQSDKAARPFGAPDSDEDEEDEDDEGEDGIDGQPEDGVRDNSPEKEFDEKKRPKLHKGELSSIGIVHRSFTLIANITVEVDDGEAGEVTVVSVRAKMFSLDKETGWKERGAGMLKINVPHACVEFDDAGAVIPGSFDASGLEALEDSGNELSHGPKVARLILRQDQTHRVILNTAILPAMTFQEKATLNSVGVLFTALEGSDAKPVSTTMRVWIGHLRLKAKDRSVLIVS